MVWLLAGLGAVNLALCAALVVVALRRRRSLTGRTSRLLTVAVAATALGLALTVAQRAAAYLTSLGVLPEALDAVVYRPLSLAVSLATTALAVGGLYLAVLVTRRLEERDAAFGTLVSRPPSETVEAVRSVTPREREVLTVMALGKVSDDDIAAELYVSPKTAATHVRNIMRKCNLHTRHELVLAGQHLVDLDDRSA